MSVYDFGGVYDDVTTGFAAEAGKTLAMNLARIEHCVNQLSDEQLWWRPQPQMNSIGNLLLHLAGNTGQWIVAPIQNIPSDRNRPAEFAERGPIPKDELVKRIRDAVENARRAIETIDTPAQLLAARRIQGNDTNILTAVFHSVSHFEGHAQEIIGMTRQILGERYKFLWVPKTPEQTSAK